MPRIALERWRAAARVCLGLVVISSVWYATVALILAVGSVHPYALGEHAVILTYCAVSYAGCRVAARWTARPWWAIAASYGVAAGPLALVFVAMRLYDGAEIWLPGIAINVGFALVTVHSSVAGAWFLARHVRQRLAAVEARHAAERARAQAELRALRLQVDPHFLFNNLHVLSALVRREPAQAEQFSEQLAAFYRQMMRHGGDEWVELDDELALVASYLHLLQARLGGALRVRSSVPAGSGYFVVPGVLQELIDNAIKHNHGSDDQPIDIALELDGEHLVARSSLRPKRAVEASGRGLAMFGERYRLQAGEALQWGADGGEFVVRVPLIEGVA